MNSSNFVLTGKPASRATSRLYNFHEGGDDNNVKWSRHETNDDDGYADGSSDGDGAYQSRQHGMSAPNYGSFSPSSQSQFTTSNQQHKRQFKDNSGQRRSSKDTDHMTHQRWTVDYQTVTNSAMVTNAPMHNSRPIGTPTDFTNTGYGVSRHSMTKTKNKYRPRSSRPSQCDEMLFGHPSLSSEYKEWKAPWDNSRTSAPLLFDSTDRAGNYSPNKPDTSSHRPPSGSRTNQRRPWR